MNEIDRDKLVKFDAELERHRAIVEADRPVFEGVMKFAELAIKHLFFLTGGAAIALLAFTGNAINGKSTTMKLEAIASAILWCGYAAALAVFVSGLSYLAQISAREIETREWAFQTLRSFAILCWLGSLALFILGVREASSALTVNLASSGAHMVQPHSTESATASE